MNVIKERNVVMLLYKDLRIDTRVLRESLFLAEEGFNVSVINVTEPTTIAQNKKLHDNITNEAIMTIKSSKRATITNLMLFWIKTFIHLIKKNMKIHFIHCHDLTALPPGIFYKILHPKTKIIYDSHELFPEAAYDKLNKFFWIVFLILEKICVPFVDIIIGASEEQLKILAKRYKKKRFCLLLNVPDLKNINNETFNLIIHNYNNKDFSKKERIMKVVYSGNVLSHRGYDTFVKVASLVIKQDPNFEFWVVGTGPYLESVKKLVKKYKLEDKFIFTGEVIFSQLLKIISLCDIGICLYDYTFNNHIMLSNKIFEYMLVGLPFVFSSLKSSIPLIREAKAICVNPYNIQQISKKIIELSRDPVLMQKISKTSHNLVMKKYNWEKESQKLLKVYKSFT